jgi:hypothetical protein
MIHVQLSGGLGNQMFQYAMARALSLSYNKELALDLRFYSSNIEGITKREYGLDVFNFSPIFSSESELSKLEPSLIKRIIRKLLRLTNLSSLLVGTEVYEEREHEFQSIRNSNHSILLKGFWQNPYYFQGFEKALKADFQFTNELEGRNRGIADQIMSLNSVSIHIRRGDYASNPETLMTHGLCSLDYYKYAIQYISERVPNPKYFIFSDDPEWVIENLKLEHTSTVVNWNVGKKSYLDMQLMSLCKHNILANSSFSWWSKFRKNNLH